MTPDAKYVAKIAMESLARPLIERRINPEASALTEMDVAAFAAALVNIAMMFDRRAKKRESELEERIFLLEQALAKRIVHLSQHSGTEQ
jgi:hypothetical protein